MNLQRVLITGLSLLSLASVSHAATYFSADTVSGFFDGNPSEVPSFSTSFDNINNGAGLPVLVTDLTDSTISTTSHNLGFNAGTVVISDDRDGMPPTIDTMQIEFGFTTPVDLSSLHIWNYSQQSGLTNRGINSYEIRLDTGSGFGVAADYTGSLAEANYVDFNHFAQTVSLGGLQTGVTGVRLNALSNHGGTAIGIDEVVFSAVPEPSAFVIAFVGVLGILARRRR